MRFPLPADWLPFPLIFGKVGSCFSPCAFVSGPVVIVSGQRGILGSPKQLIRFKAHFVVTVEGDFLVDMSIRIALSASWNRNRHRNYNRSEITPKTTQ